jgi:cell division protein FtsZ
MRVTVVATGLGEMGVAELPKPTRTEAPPVQLVNSDIEESSMGNYSDLDRPTVIRNGAVGKNAAPKRSGFDNLADGNLEYLDVPAFLRRQAD